MKLKDIPGVMLGKKITECSYDPKGLVNVPIGMFHCPECLTMVLAGQEHGQVDDVEFNMGYNEGSVAQGEVEVELDRKMLAMILYNKWSTKISSSDVADYLSDNLPSILKAVKK